MSAFELVSPESLGIRSRDILEFLTRERDAGIELHSFMIIRRGKIAAEGWYSPYRREARHILFSFSKTLTAIAVGFAVSEGLLSLDERIVSIFPEECPEEISENLALVDIESLLTMNSGQAEEISGEEINSFGGNFVRAFLAHDFPAKPGSLYQYNTRGTDLLCAALMKKTGQNLTEYLMPRFFQPLDIDPFCFCMEDRIVKEGAPYGKVSGGGWGFCLTTEDMAKIAWFLNRRGNWEGRQLLSEDWCIKAASKRVESVSSVYQPVTLNWQQGYGYQCWMNALPGSFRADGAYGQFGYVIPDKDAVIVMTAAAVNTERQLEILEETVARRMSDEAFPENQEDLKALREMTDQLRLQGLWGIRQMWTERELEGKSYLFEEAPVSFEEFLGGEGHYVRSGYRLRKLELHFTETLLEISIEEEDPSSEGEIRQSLSCGMDGDYRYSLLSDGEYAASGRFFSQNSMELEVRCPFAAGGTRLILTFDGQNLEIRAGSTIPEEGGITEREIRLLRGRREPEREQ